MIRLPILVIVLTSLPLMAADDKAKTDQEKIQGTWKIVAAVCNQGEEKDMKRVIGRIITFKGDKVIQGKAGDPDHGEGTFKLDPTKSPKHIDLVHAKEGTSLGLYALEGNELKLSSLEPKLKKRPSVLFAKDGDKQFLFTLERVKE